MFTTRPQLAGTFGMVASTHWLASSTGMAVLESGGNAFDAAVATGLVLQVVEPHMNGPGGEVPIIGYDAARDEVFVVCGQGPAPAAADRGLFADLGLDLIPGSGPLAACVPGAFDAWMLLLGRYGTMRPRDLMGYAIDYAAGGYPLVTGVVDTIAAVADLFRGEWPTSAATYLPHGRVPATGSLFANPALAATYRRVAAEAAAATRERDGQVEAARGAFYRGFVAETIDRWVRDTAVMDTSGRRHRGVLDAADMAAYRARIEPPVAFDSGAYRVHKTAPWGQGPVFLQQLALLGDLGPGDSAHNSAEYVHAIVECAKLAFADREAWYGDPDHADVPLDDLLAPDYAAARRALVASAASLELRPGAPGGRAPRMPPTVAVTPGGHAEGIGEPSQQFGAGTAGHGGRTAAPGPFQDGHTARPARDLGEPRPGPGGRTAGDTCHLDVVDRFGNMVAATPSGGWLQSAPVIPELGFGLGTRAQMFWLAEGLPNSLAPGKRPRTTLTPSLAFRDGAPYLAFGTPGGDQQDQWSLLFFLAHTRFGMDLQAAIDAPAFHTSHFPSSFYPRSADPGRVHVEGRLPARVVADLRARGHRVEVHGDWSLGRISAVSRDGRMLRAAANPRGMQGYAVGR